MRLVRVALGVGRSLVEKLSVERSAVLRDDLGRRPAGESGDIAERDGVAEPPCPA
jgi:hypothetical protein